MEANKRKARSEGLVEHCSRASEKFESDWHFPSYSGTKYSLQNTHPD
ncbi:hypothetical protein N7E02_00505 (plasmid) [Aliirhizobium terrae]|nr:hypothetical protein [Rhizobium sp. CC-CFT758]WJH37951.1 hypothetical protein N7E02_00505 [Rhizobium sp. CC-CFT758]